MVEVIAQSVCKAAFFVIGTEFTIKTNRETQDGFDRWGVKKKVHEFLSFLSWFQMNNQEKFIIFIENVWLRS